MFLARTGGASLPEQYRQDVELRVLAAHVTLVA
jgi:hypothetical protein